jgi:hypothetical protein
VGPCRGYFPKETEPRVRQTRQQEDATMTVALQKASNTLVIAAQLYRELAVSASDLFRPSTYR